MESVNQIKSIVKSIFDCDTIPPEPDIFSAGFVPDRTNKYVQGGDVCNFSTNLKFTTKNYYKILSVEVFMYY